MATEALRVDSQQDSIEALSREAESLKMKLIEEKAKLNDTDCKYKISRGYLVSLLRFGWLSVPNVIRASAATSQWQSQASGTVPVQMMSDAACPVNPGSPVACSSGFVEGDGCWHLFFSL